MKKSIVLSVFALVFSMSMSAQSILEWNFYGTTAVPVTGKETTSDACYNDVDLEKAVLTRGSGAPGNNGYTNGFVGTIQPSSSKIDAVAGNVYLEFKVQPKTGSSFNLSELITQIRTQTACTYQWMYSKNNSQFTDLGSAVSMDSTGIGVDQTPINILSIPELQNMSSTDSVTFRIYVWGGTKVQGFGFGKSAGNSNTAYKASIILKGNTPVIAGWNFENIIGTTQGSLNATNLSSNLQSAILGRGAGLTAGSLNISYASTTSLQGITKTAAIENNEYFEISLNAKEGFKTSLTALNYKYRRNSSGPAGYKWRYSLNGTDFSDVGTTSEDVSTANADGVSYSINLADIPNLQNVVAGTTIILRMYIWGSGANTQVFGFGRYYFGSIPIPGVNTICVKGSVDAVSGINDIQDSKKAYQVYNSGNQIIIKSELQKNDLSEIRISDISGKNICKFNLQIQTGENTLPIPLTLAKGIYLVSVIEKNGNKTTVKFNR